MKHVFVFAAAGVLFCLTNGPVCAQHFADGGYDYAQPMCDAQHPCCPQHGVHYDDFCCPRGYSRMAHSNVVSAFEAQANKGRILNYTVWNHHFEEGTAELRPSGVALLNRLARRQQASGSMDVFLQTANDIRFDPAEPAAFAGERAKLDAQRAKALGDYVAIVLRRDTSGIFVYDPDPVGMTADEASAVYKSNVAGGVYGVLPPNLVNGTIEATISIKKGN
ncbi:MAG: hypothetical protein KDA41_05215 [Planctomycetales bacterium]|nr:hypothetical protein [Planctomycetales bacterium]